MKSIRIYWIIACVLVVVIAGIILVVVKEYVYSNVDLITEFVVRGKVLDRKTNFALKEVQVKFVDLGLDEIRSKKQASFILKDVSDSLGIINIKFGYWWGYRSGLFYRKPKGSFLIELSKVGYKTKRLNFKIFDLFSESDRLIVPLNDVYLDPES